MEKQNNYNKYWKNWNVLQTPKINFDLMSEDGWNVFDADINGHATVAIKDNIEIRAEYSNTGGVNKIIVKKDDSVVYEQIFNFLLKPTISEIQKIFKLSDINDWRKYYTAC